MWEYSAFDKSNAIQNRTIRLYLGVHRFAPNLAINGDMSPICSGYCTSENDVKNILTDLNMVSVLNNEECVEPNDVHDLCCKRKIPSGKIRSLICPAKLRTYCKFKEEFQVDP